MIDIYRRWITRAACFGQPTGLFFPESIVPGGREAPKKQDWDKAKRVCLKCPVMAQCRRDHLGERYGVWGGLDPDQRKEQVKRRSSGVMDFRREDKVWLAKFITKARNDSMPPTDLQRLIALSPDAIEYLVAWWEKERNPNSTINLPGVYSRQPGIHVTDKERRKILNLARQGTLTQREIAQRVRRTPNTVSLIIRKSKEGRGSSTEGARSVSTGDGTTHPSHRTSQLLDAG